MVVQLYCQASEDRICLLAVPEEEVHPIFKEAYLCVPNSKTVMYVAGLIRLLAVTVSLEEYSAC